jgi:hypothetical protein
LRGVLASLLDQMLLGIETVDAFSRAMLWVCPLHANAGMTVRLEFAAANCGYLFSWGLTFLEDSSLGST